jgi:NTP pyrophosphatase (non-canonical NTP hydrolase)
MNADEYQKQAERTMTDDTTRLDRMTNAALGLAGESGEIADMIKKHLYHEHQLDLVKLKKELGDVQWYIAQMCNAINTTVGEIMELNIEKLLIRYPDGFSFERSINRDE